MTYWLGPMGGKLTCGKAYTPPSLESQASGKKRKVKGFDNRLRPYWALGQERNETKRKATFNLGEEKTKTINTSLTFDYV